MTSARPAAFGILALAAASWLVVVRQMQGMDMGVATTLGSFGFFLALWVSMMASMMLPGAVPAAIRHARARGRARAVPPFVASTATIDLPLALATAGFGVLVLVAPAVAPGLTAS